MRELPVIEDKRLLGALDYIDERFIAEVTEEYEVFDTAPGAKLPPRARMYRFRQFAALAACLLLLSFASLGVNHVANAVISFAASAGGSLNEYGSKYERAIDAYPDDMSVEDIYEDVLKGGWVVYNGDVIQDIELLFDFYTKVIVGEEASVLVASYYHLPSLQPHMSLKEIVFDGSKYVFRSNNYYSNEPGQNTIMSEKIYTREYRYLIFDDCTPNDGVYFLLSDDGNTNAQKWKEGLMSFGPRPEDTLSTLFLLHISQETYDLYFGS